MKKMRAIRFHKGSGEWSRWVLREETIREIVKELIKTGPFVPFQLCEVEIAFGQYYRGDYQ